MPLNGIKLVCAATILAFLAQPARADEIFVGITAHEVDTPFTLKTVEKGADIQLGYRGKRMERLKKIGRPAPYVLLSVNSAGDTSFVAAGLGWTIGDKFYVRPGIGLALHDGGIPQARLPGRRTDLGSRLLFEPEVSVGYRLSDRVSMEINWTHISNGQILSGQNPGLDMIGLRASFRL